MAISPLLLLSSFVKALPVLLLVVSISACAHRQIDPPNITILVSTYDAGMTSVEAFKLNADGLLGGGRWTSDNRLINHYSSVEFGVDGYDKMLTFVSEYEAKKVDAPSDIPVLGPPSARSVEIVLSKTHTQPKTHTQQFLSLRLIPPELADLLKQMNAAVAPQKPGNGLYIWAMPAHPDTRSGNLDFVQLEMKQKLEVALKSVDLIVPIAPERAKYYTEHFRHKSRAVAESSFGKAYFGILNAQD